MGSLDEETGLSEQALTMPEQVPFLVFLSVKLYLITWMNTAVITEI
jgi:hypothetical protein